jgi:hypothetical protein
MTILVASTITARSRRAAPVPIEPTAVAAPVARSIVYSPVVPPTVRAA